MLYFPGSRSHVAWEKGSFGFLIACRGDFEQEVTSLEPRLICSTEGSDVHGPSRILAPNDFY